MQLLPGREGGKQERKSHSFFVADGPPTASLWLVAGGKETLPLRKECSVCLPARLGFLILSQD